MINIQPIQKQRQRHDGSTLSVHSIFYTLQGEGMYAGRPAVFVRLAGCNLQCPLCDTEYTNDAKEMSISEIIDKVFIKRSLLSRPIIVISGGEPFRQNIGPLVQALDQLYIVQIETNGTLPPPLNFPKVTVVCSPKTGKVNKELLPYITAYKYVMRANQVSKLDGLPITALDHTAVPELARPHKSFNGQVYLQPCDQQNAALNQRNTNAVLESCMTYGYTLQLQIHKLIGVE